MAAVLCLLLNGCVAAAIPIAAGSVLAGTTSQKRHDRLERQRAAAAAPAPVITHQAQRISPPPAPPAKAIAPPPQPLARNGIVLMQGMTELPSPSSTADTYAALVDFAVAKAADAPETAADERGNSVVLTEGSQLSNPSFVPCGMRASAVVLDLDPGKGIFDPAAPGTAQPGLAARLAALRMAGITVMWSSSLPVGKAQAVYDRLRASGLDPDGIDRLLLVRKADERKQTRRLEATRDWCIIAIAGDRKGDFDELFDYLRDESFAVSLARLDNAGWFIAPLPIAAPSLATTNPGLKP